MGTEKPKMVVSGIYEIRNQVNGKRYIGSTVSLQRRWDEHLRRLRRGCHINKRLLTAFQKYGERAFDLIVLEYVEDHSRLLFREQVYLDTLKPEYNLVSIVHADSRTLGRRVNRNYHHEFMLRWVTGYSEWLQFLRA